jgi:hypothetical protein
VGYSISYGAGKRRKSSEEVGYILAPMAVFGVAAKRAGDKGSTRGELGKVNRT